MSYLSKRGSVYFFRRIVPDDLRPVLGKREIMLSLRTKDREDAKRLVPAEIIKSNALFASARKMPVLAKESGLPLAVKSPAQLERERLAWEAEQQQNDLLGQALVDHDCEIEALEPIMDALAAGKPVDASPAEVARAVQLLVIHERDMADIQKQEAIARLLQSSSEPGRASPLQNEAVDCAGSKSIGRGIYLDTDIVNLWAAERSPAAKTKDSYRRVAEWLHERIGRKSVEQFTRKDILAFKDRLLADGQTPQNVNVKLGNLRTLLQWAVDNDHAENNPAMGIGLKAPANKRMTYGLADLQSLFSSPVYADGARPKQGRGEAAYWLPVLALFTGARMEELGQLRVGDIKKANYPDADNEMRSCWGMHFVADTDGNGQVTRLKNAESERFVPLHPELDRLGFLNYLDDLSDKNGRVFPELRAGAYGRQTAKWGEWYGRYVDSDTGITDKRITFHSFRHTFKDYCRLASIEEPLANRLMGHKTQGVAASYGLGYGLHNLVQAIQRYKVPGLQIPDAQNVKGGEQA